MKIAALKIQQKKLGLSDARYRALLLNIGGVRSSKELSTFFKESVFKFNFLHFFILIMFIATLTYIISFLCLF